MMRHPKYPVEKAKMSSNVLYTDLSSYYDLMCVDIDYQAQSNSINRLQKIFGNGGNNHLDLACGTGPHVRHFLDLGYQAQGLDINQPMLDFAQLRCPEASFSLQDMSNFKLAKPVDLVTCFLYSIHYNQNLDKLKSCIASVHATLNQGGIFCFNSVDKNKIDNNLFVSHTANQVDHSFTFRSAWYYLGQGEQQALKLNITKTQADKTQVWQDEHTMVAMSFDELTALLTPYFEVHIFEHDYEKIIPWDGTSGNAIFSCVKI